MLGSMPGTFGCCTITNPSSVFFGSHIMQKWIPSGLPVVLVKNRGGKAAHMEQHHRVLLVQPSCPTDCVGFVTVTLLL